MAAYTNRTPKNPNEAYGVVACSAVGQQKHPDCGGWWTEMVHVRHHDPRCPRIVVCDNHGGQSIGEPNVAPSDADLHDNATGLFPAPAASKPRKRAKRADDEVPSL